MCYNQNISQPLGFTPSVDEIMIDEDIFDKLQEQIRLEFERKKAEEATLAEMRMLRITSEQRTQLTQSLESKIDSLLHHVKNYINYGEGLKEWLHDFSNRIERIEQLATILLSRREYVVQTETSLYEKFAQQQHINSLKKRLATYQRNLQRLQEQAAQYGINVPLDMSNQIEAIETKIDKTNKELEALE